MTARDTARRARGLVRVTLWLPAELVAAWSERVGRRGRARSVREWLKGQVPLWLGGRTAICLVRAASRHTYARRLEGMPPCA